MISGSAGLKGRSSTCHWAPLVSLRLLAAEVINVVPAANQDALSLTFGPSWRDDTSRKQF